MEGHGSGSRGMLWLLALVAVMTVFTSCGRPGDTLAIPAPPSAFGDSASPAAYLAYARSLSFATEDSASAVTRHATDTSVSRLKLSPERRLVATPDSAYNVGRIIARIQTDSGVSPYSTPIGEAYIWVRRTGSTYRAQIITDEPGRPGSGRILLIPSFYHVPLQPTTRLATFCTPLDSIAPGFCCRCGGGCWDPWPFPIPLPSVETLVRSLVGL